MSKEATAQFGTKLGSNEYWSRINRDTIFGGLLNSGTDYRSALEKLGTRARSTIEDIYDDLSKLGSKIRYLPSSNRNALAKQVSGLYDICRMGGAMLGASIGSIFPGPGTAIGGFVGGLVFGIIGSYGGDKLGEYVIDITMTE